MEAAVKRKTWTLRVEVFNESSKDGSMRPRNNSATNIVFVQHTTSAAESGFASSSAEPSTMGAASVVVVYPRVEKREAVFVKAR